MDRRSSHYAANAAWVACTVLAFNRARGRAAAAVHATARWARLLTRVITVPARIASTGPPGATTTRPDHQPQRT
ncbi:hypothetical protein BKD30_06865 [Tersicoccus phoenicis]|uniref:Uncharacterized protein n=1 Tax=Tersicoccus phoenicis TaxID=554083 RepID=A0A1R1LBX1_9MICC|nr:hypothetical protein [Tersicoccus phoenicis]OMH25004.1 hypothetical protein BKD30_06865 [Tersicoccus phoenicis]